MHYSMTRRLRRTLPFAAALTLMSIPAYAQGLDKALDGFFESAFGWFVALIFYSVPLGDAQFPLIAGWLLIAA